MLNDLLQSKNAPAALILLGAGVLLAVVLPVLTTFPGWAAGFIGLTVGSIAGVLALQGRGANRDELLAIRTGVKAAQRGERASRPAALSRDLVDVFNAVDDLAEEVDSRLFKLRECEAVGEKLRAELQQREDQLALAGQDLLRVMDAISSVQADQSASTEQVAASLRQTGQALASIAEGMEQLEGSAEQSSSSMLALASASDEFVATTSALGASVRDVVSAVEHAGHELEALEHAAEALSALIEDASSAVGAVDRCIDATQNEAGGAARQCELVAHEAEHAGDLVHRAGLEFERIEESVSEATESMTSVATRLDTVAQSMTALDDLGEQMTLLALNGAIIAAQAGEHGKGFAVVADGVKELAERSGVSSKELSGSIRGIGDQTKSAIHAIERVADTIDRGSSTSAEAELAAKRIGDSAQRATLLVAAASRQVAEQQKSSKQVSDGIERVAAGARQLASLAVERARGLEPMLTQTEKVRLSIQQLERGQQEQSQRSRQLTSGTENLSRTIAQLVKVQRNQARTIDDTALSVERLRELLREHERRLSGLVTVSERMQRVSSRNGV